MNHICHRTQFGILCQGMQITLSSQSIYWQSIILFVNFQQQNTQLKSTSLHQKQKEYLQNFITTFKLGIFIIFSINYEIDHRMTTPQNGFTFQIKNPGSTKNKTHTNMLAMKKIDNYSYALNDEIGLGFTSHVYKGKCQLTNMPVAVKVIELKKTEDELHANFLKEEVAMLETIKTADSKNLLKLQKVIKSKNNLYLITEFCEGNDVAKILRKKKFIKERQAQSIMKQVLNGYKQLYRLKIIHRDLKLANLFITKGYVKIADFGFAIGEEQSKIKIDYNVGSPFYMPPQSLKKNQYSYLSDVWAMGVIAYQLVYGKVPWKDKDDEVLYEMIHNSPIERLFDPSFEISEHYKKFIKACLTIDLRFRASPQFIINYQWPMAEDYVDGLEDENQFRYSMGARATLPRMSIEKPQLKRIISDNSDPLVLRKRTPSADNLNNFMKSQEHPPSKPFPPPRANQAVTKSFIQQEKVVFYNDGSRERASTVKNFQSKPIPVESKNKTELAVLGQVHFCRFMLELLKILRNRITNNERTSKIESQLSYKISEKIQSLVKMAQSEQNIINSSEFEQYVRTQRWQGLRQLIYKYDMKFREELMGYSVLNRPKSEDSQVIQVLKQMKSSLPTNLKIVELLAYYHQLKDEETRVSPEEFEERTKISYLVDECKHYTLNALGERNQNELHEKRDRLMKKLAILGI